MSERKVEVQTDKSESKLIPCTYPDCTVDLKVNKFYAPHKGRCSQHGNAPAGAIRSLAAPTDSPDSPATPNRSLADLRCPLCDSKMKLIKINESSAAMSFACLSSFGRCMAAVTITPNWGPMLMNDVPPAWKDFVEIFNIDVRTTALDERAHGKRLDPAANVEG